ncbi:MAG: von Willebrand factor type A domain-containing protein [Bacteroidota bacterium]|nr:von Willebrand factor type A domain-containing protein [Bacteroidota bacterium]MDP4248764.1 von Willebrand factor type A domain-containing protein [Bacteroidota bacterium]
MKTLPIILYTLLICLSGKAQYYLRGEVKDESNNPVSNVRIMLHSSGYLYYSGNLGGFGITLPNVKDSLTLSADGYYPSSISVNATEFQSIIMKARFPATPKPLNRLLSLTKNLSTEELNRWTVAAETYSSLVENEFLPADRYPETGFAININKASYSNIRRFLNMENSVPPDAIRIEEMLNYFNYDYSLPSGDSTFSFRSAVSSCPWNSNNQLLFLQVCAKKANMDSIPSANLVFLIDVSGSMDLPNRLPLLKSAFSLMVNNLRDKDTVSIVVYGGVNGVWLTPTSGGNKKKILESIAQLEPGGATPGEGGIRAAYRLAKSQFIKGGTNRVILATDGDFNVGEQSEEELNRLISSYRTSDIYLTCLGVGMGNYKDSKLEVLANRGKGNFAYLDNEKEAEKVLMEEFAQTIYAVAKDAYIDIHFDPSLIKSYRLIGFDNKLNALSDTSNILQGGEIGSGHTLMALLEIEPTQPRMDSGFLSSCLAKVSLHYQLPNADTARMEQYTVPYRFSNFNNLPKYYRFASSVALFGGLLKNSRFVGKASWDELLKMAGASYDINDVSQKEYLQLIEKAKKIYHKTRKKKNIPETL